MPSKGSSRTATQSRPAVIEPSAGPAVVAAPLGVVASAPVAMSVAPGPHTEPEATTFIPELEDGPDVASMQWVDLYAQTVERHRDERDRIDREQGEAQRLW
ncbi:MAG: hypothetical protein ACREEC_11435, partial [Thermoplasmata archaeon]